MVNVNVRITNQGCQIEVGGETACFPTLTAARTESDDAAVGFALLCKGNRLLKDGEFRFQSSYPITTRLSAYTGTFEQSGCSYQMSLFVEKTDLGEETVKAVQFFPAQEVSRFTDVYVSDPKLLAQTGFMESVRRFVSGGS